MTTIGDIIDLVTWSVILLFRKWVNTNDIGKN